MDIFMDKLAQRATAQEIIKANTAADVEELNKLKNQIGEYNECLAELRRLIDEGSRRLADTRSGNDDVRRLVEEELSELKTLRRTAENAGNCQRKITEQLGSIEESLTRRLEDMSVVLEEKINIMNPLKQEQLTEKLSALEENMHKECVKVYRNVQAVVTEESGRQSEGIGELTARADSLRRRVKAVFGVSIAALIVSLAGIVFQILDKLNVLPF